MTPPRQADPLEIKREVHPVWDEWLEAIVELIRTVNKRGDLPAAKRAVQRTMDKLIEDQIEQRRRKGM